MAVEAHATAAAALYGFPMVGPGVGASARVRVHDWLLVAPHVDALAVSFIMIGSVGAQVGLPFVAEVRTEDGITTFIGAGPMVSWSRFGGHVEPPVPVRTELGAEALLGFVVPLNDSLDGVIQLRGFGGVGDQVPVFSFGAAASAGVGVAF